MKCLGTNQQKPQKAYEGNYQMLNKDIQEPQLNADM